MKGDQQTDATLSNLFCTVKARSNAAAPITIYNSLKNTDAAAEIIRQQDLSSITILGYACKNGHIDLVKIMLKDLKVVPNCAIIDEGAPSPLWLAATQRQTDIVEVLLNAGASVDKKAPDGTTALTMAITKKHWNVVDAFKKHCPKLESEIFLELAKFGEYEQLVVMNLKIQEENAEIALWNAALSNRVQTLDYVEKVSKRMIFDCQSSEDRFHSVDMRKRLSLEMNENNRDRSLLEAMSDRFPALVASIQQDVMTSGNAQAKFINIERHVIPFIFGDFCIVKHYRELLLVEAKRSEYFFNRDCDGHVDLAELLGEEEAHLFTEQECYVGQSMYVGLMSTKTPCEESCKKEKCKIIRDIITTCQLLERELNSENCPLMSQLMPRFVLIGSTAEGTGVVDLSDVDLTVRFLGLRGREFIMGDQATTIRLPKKIKEEKYYRNNAMKSTEESPEVDLMEEFMIDDKGTFNYPLFLTRFLEEIDRALSSIKLPSNITLTEEPADCQHQKWNWSTIYAPNRACSQCVPQSVTHTKLGACLILKWQDLNKAKEFIEKREKPEKPIIVSIDLIPTFPVKTKGVVDMFGNVIRTLSQEQPPNWLRYFRGFMASDNILPEAFALQYDPVGVCTSMVALKILNYGPKDNYIVMPAQKMLTFEFQLVPKLKQVYQYLRVLNKVLGVNEKSYGIKKVMLLPDFIKRAKDNEMTIDELLLEAVVNSDLRMTFQKRIDLEGWEKEVHKCKEQQFRTGHVDIPLHRR